MANTLANLARMYTETTGTGTLTLTTAVPGFNTFADAGVTTGSTVTYAIYCGPHREIGSGVYTASGLTLTRASVYSSTNGNAKINLTGRSEVFITVAKEDFDTFLTTAAAAGAYQPLDSDLTSIAALTTAAYGRSLLETTSESNFKATVNLEIGTDVQAYDAELAAIAGLTSAADKLPYFTGSGTAALADLTTFGRSLIDDAAASNARTTLGLGTAATQNTGTSGANVPLLNAANTWSGSVNAFGYLAGTGAVLEANADSAFGAPFSMSSADGSASRGPNFLFRRSSGSPLANDDGGAFLFQGNDDALANQSYATIGIRFASVASGSITGRIRFQTQYSGSFAERVVIQNGLIVGSPTGDDKLAGTVNAVTIYENGTSLASKYGALASANVWTATDTIRIDNASTNSVTVAQTLSHTTTGTPANGIGVSLAFEAETTAGNNEVGATIEAVVTDVTSTSEDFDLVFKAMAAGATAAERMRIKSTGSILTQTGALATNATDGFLYVPTCAGTPTGTPTAQTGVAPIVVDTTNNKLYFYSGGAWRDAGP